MARPQLSPSAILSHHTSLTPVRMQAEIWGDLPHLVMLRMLERSRGWTRKASRQLQMLRRADEANPAVSAARGDGIMGDGDSLTDEGLVRVCERLPALTSLSLGLCREVVELA